MDPEDFLNPYIPRQRLPMQPLNIPRAQPAGPSPLNVLTNKTLGGLQYLGETLDKPGRAIRGTISGLSGGPWGGGLGNLLPFSDTLGITDPQQSVSGRDLLDMAGVTPANQPGFHPIDNPVDALGDIGGFTAEVLLDPLTYATFGAGALTQSGKAARKAGTLEKTLAGRIREGQGGLLGMSATPFGQPDMVLGTGKWAQGLADNAIDPAMDAIKYGKYSPVPRARSLFDYRVEGEANRLAQRTMDANAGQREALASSARAGSLGVREEAARLGLDDRLINHAIDIHEGADPAMLGLAADELDRINQWLPTFKTTKDAPYMERGKLGKTIAVNERHAPRYASQLDQAALNKATGRRPMSSYTSSDMSRNEALAMLRRSQVNQLTSDPQFAGFGRSLNDLQAASAIRKQMIGVTTDQIRDVGKRLEAHLATKAVAKNPVQWARELAQLQAERAALVQKWKAGDQLAAWSKEVPHAQLLQPIFGNNPMDDLSKYLGEQYRSIGSQRNALDMVAANAKIGPRAADNMGAVDSLVANGLDDQAAVADNLAQRISESTGVPVEQAKSSIAKGEVQVPREVYDLLATPQAPWQVPNSLAPIVDLYDKAMSLTKGGLTSALPMGIPFSSRNRTGGMAKSFIERSLGGRGTLDAGAVAAGRAINNPEAYAKAGMIPAGLSGEEATRELARQAYIHAGIGDMPRTQVAGQLQGELAGKAASLPLPGQPGWAGNDWTGLADWFTKGWKGNWMPGEGVGIRGVNTPIDQPSTWTPFAKGEQLATGTETINRLETFLNKGLQGYAGSEAGKAVNRAHFDYSALAPFEREVMKRIVPFYAFTRKNLGHEASILATDPARSAAMVRATTEPRSDEYIPNYIRERASMAMPTASGAMRYVTGFGLPIEQAAQQFVVGPGGLSRTADQALAQVNPYPRLLLEQLAGRQFFSGRPHNDLDPLLGRITSNINELAGGQPFTREQVHQYPALLEQLVSSSPLSRALSMARTATDPRKRQTPADLAALALALGTGLKIQDVSPEDMKRSEKREARQMAEQLFDQDPAFRKFSRYYMTPQGKRTMTPEQHRLMAAYNLINR